MHTKITLKHRVNKPMMIFPMQCLKYCKISPYVLQTYTFILFAPQVSKTNTFSQYYHHLNHQNNWS
jgi:hypothetical protein